MSIVTARTATNILFTEEGRHTIAQKLNLRVIESGFVDRMTGRVLSHENVLSLLFEPMKLCDHSEILFKMMDASLLSNPKNIEVYRGAIDKTLNSLIAMRKRFERNLPSLSD
jgi:hypothetical protein